jgi:hypothetical protein
VVNNTTVKVVEEIGGRTALLALADKAFKEAKRKILDAVRGKLEDYSRSWRTFAGTR